MPFLSVISLKLLAGNINVPYTTEVVNGAETKAVIVLYSGQNKTFCQRCWNSTDFSFKQL